MEKTTLRSLFLLTIITGSLFTLTACGSESKVPDTAQAPTPAPVQDVQTVAPDTVTVPVETAQPVPVAPQDVVPTTPIKRALDPVPPPVVVPKPVVKVTTKYADGTYTQNGLYSTPGGETSIKVSVTVKNDTVQSLDVVAGADGGTMRRYQDFFIEGVNSVVVGQKLDNVNVDAINGASLTAMGFNQAMDQARSSAQK